MTDEWQQRFEDARQRLAPLSFLVGRWSGVGHSHGAPMTGQLIAEWVLSETVLQVRERLFDEQGIIDHEDLTFYHYKRPDQKIWVQQMTAPALFSERPVLLLEDGSVRWYEGPVGPKVFLRPAGADGLTIEVFLPLAETPALTMRYHRTT